MLTLIFVYTSCLGLGCIEVKKKVQFLEKRGVLVGLGFCGVFGLVFMPGFRKKTFVGLSGLIYPGL